MKNLIFLLLFPLGSFAQVKTVLKGTAYDADRRSKLEMVFVNNLTQQEAQFSGQKGDFAVPAELGDLLVFSCPGYESDTLVVENLSPKLVLLKPSIIVLQEVVVSARANPENVKEAYSNAYSYANTNILSLDGKVSLYNAFSRQAKQKRAFQDMMSRELDEKAIDARFTKSLVQDLTKVHGQVLEDFMSYYRPTLSELKAMSDMDLRNYIVRSYNAYIKLPAEARIYPPLPNTTFSGNL